MLSSPLLPTSMCLLFRTYMDYLADLSNQYGRCLDASYMCMQQVLSIKFTSRGGRLCCKHHYIRGIVLNLNSTEERPLSHSALTAMNVIPVISWLI